MSALSPTEQALFNVAKASLPRCLFTDDVTDITPELAAFAKQFAPVFATLDLDVQDTFITAAATEALNQHAKDRGTRRQENETNEALALRLRFMREDAVTVEAVILRTTQILDSFGITIPAGYPAVTELRRDCLHYGASRGLQIECVAVASLVDGETFTIGGNVFEFDKIGDGVAPGHIRVSLVGISLATSVANFVAAALPIDPALRHVEGSVVVIRRMTGALSDTVADAGFVIRRKGAYYSRGYRYNGVSRQGTIFVVMLPYGTTVEAAASVAEALRLVKAGGVKVIVERRLSP